MNSFNEVNKHFLMSMSDIMNFLVKQRNHHTPQEIKKFSETLNIEFPSNKVILVAGTNGKGSTCSTLQTLLIASNKNVGFFSSPHLINVNERIKFNGKNISDEDFIEIFNIVHNKLSQFNLSYFEYLTLIAAYYFCFKKNIDFVIFEIGMGGTLDSTNAFDHDISVITKLGLDHEDILGKGLKSIAKNKFGIIRKHNKVFHTKFPDEVVDLYKSFEKTNQVQSIKATDLDYFIVSDNKYPEYFVQIDNLPYKLNLLGKRAVENTSLAIEVFKYLEKDYKKYLPALQKVSWSCRMEKIRYKNKDVFLSGDHNPQAIQSLIEILNNFTFKNVYIILGTCFDKDYDQMLNILSNNINNSHISLTETPTKTLSIEDYSDFSKSVVECLYKNPIEALEQIYNKATDKDLILVTGSLYLTGFIKNHIMKTQKITL